MESSRKQVCEVAALASHGRGHSAARHYIPSKAGGHTSRTLSSLHSASQRSSEEVVPVPVEVEVAVPA